MIGARPETHPARRPGVRPAALQHERVPEVRLPALARRDRRLDRRDVRAGFPPDEVDEELGRRPDFAREVGCFFLVGINCVSDVGVFFVSSKFNEGRLTVVDAVP